MSALDPQAVHELWAERFRARDLDGLLALYEPDAALAARPGEVAVGSAAIREALTGFLLLTSTLREFRIEAGTPIQAGDVALLHSRWSLAATGPDGRPLELGGMTADVLRRQADGTWRLLVDNPWGAG